MAQQLLLALLLCEKELYEGRLLVCCVCCCSSLGGCVEGFGAFGRLHEAQDPVSVVCGGTC